MGILKKFFSKLINLGKACSDTHHCVDEITLLQKLSEAGDAESQIKLGVKYVTGDGVSQDYEKAFTWWSKASDQGNPKAIYNLARMYYRGLHVQQNYEAALLLFKKAALEGIPMAQNDLGVMYCEGNYHRSYGGDSMAPSSC